ncbi:MAG: hypothetical protein M5U19_22570 [Microthrixaceae bacterium]|nr:hypothetical protein [Microthrixaceae bacterium]
MTEDPVERGGRKTLARLLRIAGIVLALAAVGFLLATLVEEWPAVSASIADARPFTMLLAWALSLAAMWGLAVLWYATLAVFGSPQRLVDVSAWYFAGELGKYLPGGIWPVVGRGNWRTVQARSAPSPTARRCCRSLSWFSVVCSCPCCSSRSRSVTLICPAGYSCYRRPSLWESWPYTRRCSERSSRSSVGSRRERSSWTRHRGRRC